MQRELNQVRQFHRRIGASIADKPKLLDCDPEAAGKVVARLQQLAQFCREHGQHESTRLWF